MQIKPVTKADKPEYPTAGEIDIPKVLNASKPNKWKRNAAIGAVMVGMLLAQDFSDKERIDDHDTGIGAYPGIWRFAESTYLSEQDARKIIINEFLRDGIKLDTIQPNTETIKMYFMRELPWNVMSFDSITRRLRHYSFYYYKWRKRYPELPVKPDVYFMKQISIDGFSIDKDIAFVYISKDDQNCFNDSVYRYDNAPYENVAQAIKVRNSWLFKNKSISVFYEPIVEYFADGSKSENRKAKKRAIAESKDSLRAQVRDFLKWYKANKGKK